MRAVICSDFGESGLIDVPRPESNEGDALISVHIVQLSVTKCLQHYGTEIANLTAVRAKLTEGKAQLFGNEFADSDVETGDRVTEFEIGDQVFAAGKVVCGDCADCAANRPHFCNYKEHIGKDRPGAVDGYIIIPENALCELPDNITDAEGAAHQSLVSSLCYSVYSGNLDAGEIVTIIDNGVIGYQCG